MSTNQYNTTLTPQADPLRENVYLIQRPTFVSYADMEFTFNLLAGQPLRLRETITFAATRVAPLASYIWQNRPFDEGFMGTYVITKELETGSSFGTISRKIIGKREPIDDDIFSFAVSYDWELNLYPRKNDRPTFGSVIKSCNTELRPAVVTNTEITLENALEYAKIAFLLGKKQLGQAADAISKLSEPVTTGYRLPDGIVFRADNQTQIVGLSQGQIATAIGDLWVKLEPDWAILENADYDIRAIEFGLLEPTLPEFQFPATIECQLPEDKPQLPISSTCYVDFQSFLFSTPNAYPSLAQAQTAAFLLGVTPKPEVVEREWLCPTDSADVYAYWTVQNDTACSDEWTAFQASWNDPSVSTTEAGAIAGIMTQYNPIPAGAEFVAAGAFWTCSTDATDVRPYYFGQIYFP